jgi:hypothetical protein
VIGNTVDHTDYVSPMLCYESGLMIIWILIQIRFFIYLRGYSTSRGRTITYAWARREKKWMHTHKRTTKQKKRTRVVFNDSTVLVGPGRFFSLLIYSQSVGLLGRVFSTNTE